MKLISRDKECIASIAAYGNTPPSVLLNGGTYTMAAYPKQWWKINLGSVYTVEKIHYESYPSPALRITVEYSTDDINYKLLSNDVAVSGLIKNIDCNIKAKYIKISCIDGTSWCTCSNVQIYAKDVLYLINSRNKYYSIVDDYYDIENKKYNSIDNMNEFDKYFSLNKLFKENNINNETFIPINKFKKIKLLRIEE